MLFALCTYSELSDSDRTVRDASGHVRTTSVGLAAEDTLDITFSHGGTGAKVTRPR